MRRGGPFLLATWLLVGDCPPGAWAQERPQIEENRPLFLPDVSPSPLVKRSGDARNAAERSAQFFCLGAVIKVFEAYSGSEDARQYAQGAFFMSCVLKRTPSDWPDRQAIRRHAADLAEAAKRADPSIDACLLSACAVSSP